MKINGETHYLWRAVDHEGEVLESFVMKRRHRKAAMKFLRKTMKRNGKVELRVTDQLRFYGAEMNVFGTQIDWRDDVERSFRNGTTPIICTSASPPGISRSRPALPSM